MTVYVEVEVCDRDQWRDRVVIRGVGGGSMIDERDKGKRMKGRDGNKWQRKPQGGKKDFHWGHNVSP